MLRNTSISSLTNYMLVSRKDVSFGFAARTFGSEVVPPTSKSEAGILAMIHDPQCPDFKEHYGESHDWRRVVTSIR